MSEAGGWMDVYMRGEAVNSGEVSNGLLFYFGPILLIIQLHLLLYHPILQYYPFYLCFYQLPSYRLYRLYTNSEVMNFQNHVVYTI